MIHHISLPVEDPLHVAQVLAELINGKVAPFPFNPNSYLVLAGDAYGTMFEFYPVGTELMPGGTSSPVTFSQNAFASPFTAVHAAISVPASEAQIAEVGEREGWQTVRCDRGPFQVIEFWIENKLMLELLPAPLTTQYLNSMKPENLAQFFAGASVPRPAAVIA